MAPRRLHACVGRTSPRSSRLPLHSIHAAAPVWLPPRIVHAQQLTNLLATTRDMLAEYPYLPEELVDEILVRIRPADPAGLAKACVSSRFWRQHICGKEFLRRNRELHPKPPLLGFVGNTGVQHNSTRFIPTSTYNLKPGSVPWKALDARHGRVLFHDGTSLIIWDPITKDKHVAPMPQDPPIVEHWSAVLICGVHGCDSPSCHAHESTVLFVGTNANVMVTFAGMYSSEYGIWDHTLREDDEDMEAEGPTHVAHPDAIVDTGPTVVLRNKAYFPCTLSTRIIEYDHVEDKLEVVDAPLFAYRRIRATILMTARDRVLGFAGVAGSQLHLWSREAGAGPGGALAWVKYRVLDLDTIPGIPRLVGSADAVIVVKTGAGVFTVNLDSEGEAEKVSRNKKNH